MPNANLHRTVSSMSAVVIHGTVCAIKHVSTKRNTPKKINDRRDTLNWSGSMHASVTWVLCTVYNVHTAHIHTSLLRREMINDESLKRRSVAATMMQQFSIISNSRYHFGKEWHEFFVAINSIAKKKTGSNVKIFTFRLHSCNLRNLFTRNVPDCRLCVELPIYIDRYQIRQHSQNQMNVCDSYRLDILLRNTWTNAMS